MYTKMRFLAGSQTLGERAMAALKTLFERFAADAGFPHAVREMRTKLEVAEAPGKSFKYSPGAIYDIDFITSFCWCSMPCWTSGEACATGCGAVWVQVSSTRATPAYSTMRPNCCARWSTWRGWWWGGRSSGCPAIEHGRKVADKLTGQILEREFPDRLESELDRTFEKVRAIYEKVLTE